MNSKYSKDIYSMKTNINFNEKEFLLKVKIILPL